MKSWMAAVSITLTLMVSAGWAAPRRTHPGSASPDLLLTPEIAVIDHSAAFGGHLEYGYRPRIGLGGDLLFFLEGSGGVVIAPDIAYHFKVDNRDIDLFAGAGPGLIIGFKGGSDFMGKLFVGSRFYFNPRLAAYGKVFAVLSGESSLGAAFGVSFRID